MNIDIRTLVIVLSITSLLQVIILFFQYKVNKAYHGIGWWLLGFTSEAMGYGLLFLRDLISIQLITIIFANALVLSGAIFIYIGVIRFLDKKENLGIVIMVFTVFILSFFYYTYFDNDITIRTVIIYAAVGIIFLCPAHSLFFNKSRSINFSVHFNAVLFLIQGCFFIFRAVETITVDPVNSLFTPAIMQTVSFLFLFVEGILLTFGLIIMVNQRLNAENRESKENIELFFNASPDTISISRLPDGYIVNANEGFMAMSGYTRSEVIGKSTIDIDIWHNLADRQKLVKVLDEKGFCENLEAVFQCKDGSRTIGIVSAKIIKLQGQPYLLSVTRDITERKKTEATLRESEEKYRFLIENSHDIIYMLTSDGQFTFVSPAWTTLLGHPVNQVVGKSFQLFVHPDDLPGCMAWLQKVIVTGQRQEGIEYRVRHINGSWYWHTSSAVPIRNESGAIIGFEGTARDITERKVAEDALKQTRQNYETFFNTIDEFLFVLDEQGNIIHTNTTVIDRLGYTREELLGKSVLMVHPSERRDEAGRIVDEMLRGVAEFCPVPIIKKSGIQIPVETRVSPGFWDGKPVIFGVTKDISKIRLSEEKFSKLFFINPSACGLSDLDDHKYIEINEAFCTLLGFEKNEVIGRTASDLGILTPETSNAIIQKLDSYGNITNVEADLKAKNGDIKHVLLSAENITVQEKKYRFTVVQDITERKQAEDALQKSEERYRELSIIDDLTQLYNSRHFYFQLKIELDRSNRYEQPLTLLLLDLDNFKAFNDTYGHVEGDQVLRRVGQVIKGCLRETDFAYRYGGEEFTILLPMTTSADGVITAERIRTGFEKEIFSPAPGQDVRMTVSIGLAQYRLQEEMKAFVHRVDQFMYQGKKDGKNRVCSKT
jgi:diguanylate cyclase (GGDEF)-like protein/PAS domain S-box-containing protein